jgi:hypothetical protein
LLAAFCFFFLFVALKTIQRFFFIANDAVQKPMQTMNRFAALRTKANKLFQPSFLLSSTIENDYS